MQLIAVLWLMSGGQECDLSMCAAYPWRALARASCWWSNRVFIEEGCKFGGANMVFWSVEHCNFLTVAE